MQQTDIIIAGGGMVGMSAAVALARLGLKVALLEKGELPAQLEPAFDGRVSAIARGSVNFLRHIGAWEAMRPYAEPILDIRVSEGRTPFFVHYDHRDVGEAPFGHIVENRYIRHALHEAARAHSNLTVIERAGIAHCEAGAAHATVTLADGRAWQAALVLAADGKHSQLRALAGISADEHDYRQTAIVCTIAHEKPHHGLAQERFLPAGPFAVLPLKPSPLEGEGWVGGGAASAILQYSPNGTTPHPDPPPQGGREYYRSSLVWVEPAERAPVYMALSDEECAQEIRERVGDYLGAIRIEGRRFAYPLSLMHAKDYTAPRLALIGDAAHGIHPIAGQGVNLGFRDVAVLEELVRKQALVGLDIGAPLLLEHYQRWRRFDNVTMMGVTHGLNGLFLSSLLPVKAARGLGMWAVNRLPPLKRFFMKHAMGMAGDVPEGMRG